MKTTTFLRLLGYTLCGLLLAGSVFAKESSGTITPVNTAALARYKANIIKRDDALQAFNVGFYDSDTRPESVKRSLTATMAEEQRQAILHELQKQNALLEIIANELTANRK